MFYAENNPRWTNDVVNLGFTLVAESFGKYLQRKMDEAGMTNAELARRSGVTKQNIGRLVNETPHPVTGAPPETTEETVEKLAQALGADIDEALTAAGKAPRNPVGIQPPRNMEEFLRLALRWKWIDELALATKKPISEFTEEDFADLWERMGRHFKNEVGMIR